MIAWMLYSVAVGLCTVVAARAAECLLRLRGRPVRFAWIAAGALSLLLAASAPLRGRPSPNEHVQPVELSSLALVQTSIRSVERHVPAGMARYVAGLWAIASLLVTASFVAAFWRLRRARRTWPVVDLLGERVRLSPAVGPIVVGLVRPEIILPRWVLDRSSTDQRLIIDHEVAHVRARDPIALGAACASVALMPWNPASWMILSRLRLAIEVDCDRRVLRGGVSPRFYGSLLIDVAERASPYHFAATALADDASHLHQRILAMQHRRFTHPFLLGASVALLGLASLLAACEAKMPTAADIEHMDVGSAERSTRLLGVLTPDSSLLWTIDGVASTEAAAKAIPAERIVAVEVGKFEGRKRVFVTTKAGWNTGQAQRADTIRIANRRAGMADDTVAFIRKPQTPQTREGTPLVVIDGVRSDPSALKTLDRNRIDRVDVLKGELAASRYGADGVNGVIVITTKGR
jgi:TonB-dependent SusC/RagA subfamily outer membrane receptor